ncbi:helix-turn-helix domain-containing GNAT family N-acetyltransferase [Sphingomonas sp. H39-1-10]|uniref:bifunctional helix-turn-helix transcriptional regulator/GNAT family N-acetyltransferase n=1 Tax=Sphingomonas TaxID=13687 RepID=UPI00087F852A|nr:MULTISPECIES: helix-turn-helix domain-containing GNAT family N-acetyltransferase [Sphingomonas]MDF0486515.1 helix-turn-helix domain-containing GNAT family N-acetyltransferase [Sphingomonas pollutisoli]SDA22378.1 transcriptional regulator, MarR family with acetyltransferase activity [Sphingomonas sp. NFR15]
MDETLLALRAFNRFHTQFVVGLDAHYLGMPLTLTEARLLYEIGTRGEALAVDLQDFLALDPGYASRLLRRFQAEGWIVRGRGSDARRRPVALSEAGQALLADLDSRQRAVLETRLAPLGEADRRALVGALDTARGLLSGEARAGYTIRTHRPGDMGMIAARQAILYAEQFGWGAPMEALLGEVTAAFLRGFDPARERCWIAECGGAIAGSIFAADGGDGIARLRLLYVEPRARGLGIANDLVERCIAFAREAGYTRMTLWTHTILESARRIYAAHGFRITATATHSDFGEPVQGETWELTL